MNLRLAFAILILSGRAALASDTPEALAPPADLAGWKVVPAPAVFRRLAYGNGRFVAVDDHSRIFGSTDAIHWEELKMPDYQSPEWIFHQAGSFIRVGSPVPGRSQKPELLLTVSPDGLDWKSSTVKVEAWSYFHPAFHAHGAYLVLGSMGTILTSPDAASWTVAKRVTLHDLQAVAFGAGQFVATTGAGSILTSPDGLHWTPHTSGVKDTLSAIVRFGGQFYVTTQSNSQSPGDVLLTSPDGLQWTVHRCPAGAESMYAAVAGNGRVVAVGGDKKGKVMISPTIAPGPEDKKASGSQDELVGILGSNNGGQFSVVRVSSAGSATASKPITPINGDLRTFPTVRAQAAKAEDFVPAGWTVHSTTTGDLNGDGQDDLVTVLRESERTVSTHPTSQGAVQRQMLVLAFKDPADQAFHSVQQDSSLWPPFDETSPHHGEPGISIAKGSLLLTFEDGLLYGRDFGGHYTGFKAIYQFRYQQNAFRLIGAELDSTKDYDGISRHMSVNLLSGKKITTVSKRKRETQKETFAKPDLPPALGPDLHWHWCMTLPEPQLPPFTPPFFSDEM